MGEQILGHDMLANSVSTFHWPSQVTWTLPTGKDKARIRQLQEKQTIFWIERYSTTYWRSQNFYAANIQPVVLAHLYFLPALQILVNLSSATFSLKGGGLLSSQTVSNSFINLHKHFCTLLCHLTSSSEPLQPFGSPGEKTVGLFSKGLYLLTYSPLRWWIWLKFSHQNKKPVIKKYLI